MRTTLDIDEDVLQAAKELASLQKKTAGRVLSELARKALRPTSTEETRNGVPILPPRPGATVVTPETVERLLEDAP